MDVLQHCVDYDVIGSGKFSSAAVVGLDGELLAASGGYAPSPEERHAIVDGLEHLSRVEAAGLKLCGQKFFFISSTDRSLCLKRGPDGAIVVKIKRSIIVAQYVVPVQAPEAGPILESIADELISAGY
ncbi:hypothetical protein FE391_06995 [Nonomuraea sp. KC401]|uniref:profilin n=1 Tax=unclassified Nonomuraea TaxID=2593643 RepID=UPI0010FD276E|nr:MULTISPECIES: profilin [unclassified Nonomuraea]NBE93831.1 hypothetical protein [Nonomuraea sp. K271]TLF80666.1 hypothetical protein FE391_06995 [Nonomuraea sp. KC401]